jgi:hypothetical protein
VTPGDPKTPADPTASHVYAADGVYTVSAWITDQDGDSSYYSVDAREIGLARTGPNPLTPDKSSWSFFR